jgi:hypothetical protein
MLLVRLQGKVHVEGEYDHSEGVENGHHGAEDVAESLELLRKLVFLSRFLESMEPKEGTEASLKVSFHEELVVGVEKAFASILLIEPNSN